VDATVEDANEEPSLARADDMLPAALAGEENDASTGDATTTQRVAPPAGMEQRPRSEPADTPAQGEISTSSGASQLSVIRLPGGGLRIEAPEALAEPLAALLESLARSMRQAVPPPAQNAATNGAADATREHGEPTPAEASS
jgi:hypothetical protein